MVVKILILVVGWLSDKLFGDPPSLPHPVVWFGRLIAWGERKWNNGRHRVWKGGALAFMLIVGVYVVTKGALCLLDRYIPVLSWVVAVILIFYCLAGTTLIREVRMVFQALEHSVDEGRIQVARIVGRDTSQLTDQEIRKAALETLAENLSDGVIAPLFWYLLLGVPGMVAYKMVNTLDSMIGYRTRRYNLFGRVAAHIDDVVNYIPARLTALLMILVSGNFKLFSFVVRFGHCHASPNSGYPESALAGILNCQFGGTHTYFGEVCEKPYIGTNNRLLDFHDVKIAISVNQKTEMIMIILVIIIKCVC